MVYLIWGLVGMGVVVGIALGATLGIRMDLGKMSDGTMLVGYTGEEDDGAHLFLNLDNGFAEKIPVIQRDIQVLNHRVSDIETYEHERS